VFGRLSRQGFLLLLFISIVGLEHVCGQSITRIAVIDMARVLDTFSDNTAAIRNFEQKKAEIQGEVDKMAADIKALQTQKTEAQARGDSSSVQSLDAQIAKKTADLKEYVTARQNELDIMAKALSSSNSFLQKIDETVGRIAESEGYSIVLNLTPKDDSNIVVWNSTAIDITDEVILALKQSQ
jgi:outer membrane protein